MSINAMADAAISRRTDYPPMERTPKGARERARYTTGEPTSDNNLTTAIKTLSTYVPTETLTLYVALIAVLKSSTGLWIAFAIFLLFTPTAIWITYATKVRSDSKELPLKPGYWPKWEMIAGTIAYCAWAFSLPGSVFSGYSWYSAPIAGFTILVTSTLLGMLAGVFQSPLSFPDVKKHPGAAVPPAIPPTVPPTLPPGGD